MREEQAVFGGHLHSVGEEVKTESALLNCDVGWSGADLEIGKKGEVWHEAKNDRFIIGKCEFLNYSQTM